ncbi:unnamed protein product [Prunus armeniaca]
MQQIKEKSVERYLNVYSGRSARSALQNASLPFAISGIAFPTVRNAGNRLVTVNTRRKSLDYRKPSSEIASSRALTSH